MSDIPPIRREVLIELGVEEAFELFTDGIGTWWPLERLSVFAESSSVGFKDGRLIETADERTTEWGTVTEWKPGERLSFTWHPGAEAEKASAVTVTFRPRGAGETAVILEHSGWEVFDDPGAARSEYESGWPMVLEEFRQAAGGGADPKTDTWVALMHRPGPEAPADESIFEDPRFGEHLQFLSRMHDAGYLVAAGPMLDETGAGMTILRLPGQGRLDEARRLATTEDPSVTGRFFDVSVRPWRVMISR